MTAVPFSQKLLLVLLIVFTRAIAGEAQTAQNDESDVGYETLFDGKTLEGWSGEEGFWSVVNGAITGQTTTEKSLSANSFLIWKAGELDDFELKIKFRIEGGNSGVQYRSQDLGEHHVGGYQADIDATHQFIGILYDERGRGILANRAAKVEINEKGENKVVGKTCDEAEVLASIKQSDWSEYTITAHGNHLTQAINGFVTVDIVDAQADQAETKGILALQIHTGPPMKVQFKDVRLRRLNVVEPFFPVTVAPPIVIGCPGPAVCNCCTSQSHRCRRRPIRGAFFLR